MTFTNRRKEPRRDYHREIEYLLHPNSSETYKAVTIDISDSGLGLYVFDPVSVGQQIIIKDILHGSRNIGTIRWTKKANGSIYRVGVMLVK